MPSSLIFAGLVVLWLLILVPAVARRRQEVARLSPAVLSGRVLERPTRHRLPEVDMTERRDDGGATTVGELADRREDVPSPRGVRRDEEWDRAEIDDDGEIEDRGGDHDDRYGPDHDDHDERDDRRGEREPARYRPGRGGFDPEAAAAAAHAKYAFRQRLVLALLVLLLAAGALALLVSTTFWWVAAVLGAGLAGYLTYLRRQVRIEESIRVRRASRLDGTRRPAVDRDDYDDHGEYDDRDTGADHDDRDESGHSVDGTVDEEEADEDWTADDGHDDRVRGTGQPVGVLPARCRTVDGDPDTEHTSSLPRVTATAIPPIPAGTSLVDVDDEEEFDAVPGAVEHRRAVGE